MYVRMYILLHAHSVYMWFVLDDILHACNTFYANAYGYANELFGDNKHIILQITIKISF